MFFQAKTLLTLITFGRLLSTAAGVNLSQFTRPNCRGNRASCTNIGSRVCCQSNQRVFASGSCQGCTSTDFHSTWTRQGRNSCGRNAASTNGGRCISGSSNLRGHSWCRLCRTKREEGEEPTCTESVEPNVLEIDGKWFHLKDEMPGNERDALWDLWNNEAVIADMPAEMLKYEEEMPEGIEDSM
ncbi:hypothetical protein ASPWEDRAFT_44191 [Aspergillus wentii DTO 134E9]|uniref:Uncharacterized protein n=1 Tax=Aspergillus wentii DTO 134E9 TaxID=1073089 RepID=A0A1L9RB41_ASPWE|nr:uncharacterized protein ASPWEDRAFT_44191 [Aspergillus wentii DTO 134E9]KAI9934713.1 hypothetical protein MW887_000330 [Aspergillus wentii]OJJ32139.1 hypothetical protein ASPWEDRAFT_44191 [Aspergillus wentii DTO 134E9]